MLKDRPILIDKNTALNKELKTRVFPKLMGEKNRTLKSGDKVHIELSSLKIDDKYIYIIIVQYLHKNNIEYYTDYLEAFTQFHRVEEII